jgi:hypothetical protein
MMPAGVVSSFKLAVAGPVIISPLVLRSLRWFAYR